MENNRKRKNSDGEGHEAKHKLKSESNNSTAVPAIGIDLGTTYSCVAVLRRGQVEVIKDPLYNETTVPSHVHFPREGNPLVGRAAKDMVHKEEEPKVFDAKRLIGRKFSDKEVQEDMKLWPFKVIRGKGDTPLIQLRDEAVRPEVISAHILSHLKRTAETRLNLPGQIKNAVITVPAYFNDAQRQATKDAGEIAGLNVLRIVNEPTAAAMAYDLDSDDKSERNVLIFDLGGGTFDISVLKIKKGDITVMAVGGDTHLGGEDFDNELVSFCLRNFQEKHKVNLLQNVGREEKNLILHRIREQCEQMKRVLSQGSTVTVKVYKINATHDLHVEISRKAFEELCSLRFEKCIAEVRKTLIEAGLDKSEVDEVVLAGGSSRIPKIQKMLSTLFGGKELKFTQSLDEVVACGAARLASLLNNVAGTADDAFRISDVIPHSLGIDAAINGVKGRMTTIIPKNTKIPCAKTRRYWTIYDNQTTIYFPVYEGEDPVANNNCLLGEFTLKGFPARPAGKEKADVTMKFDLNGILTVTAVGVNVAIKNSITIDSHTSRMEQTEKEKLKASLAKNEKALDSYFSKTDAADDDDNESDDDDDF